MKNYLLFVAACLFSITLSAQDETIVSKFDLDLSGAWGGWHSQLTEVGNANTVFHGGYGGLEFNKDIFIGWAAYQGSDEVGEPNNRLSYDFNYNGPMVAYTPRATKIIHPKVGLMVGFGTFDLENEEKDKLAIIQPSVGGELNVLRWFRLAGDVGYRYSLNSDYERNTVGSVDGLFAQVTLKFGFSWGSGARD